MRRRRQEVLIVEKRIPLREDLRITRAPDEYDAMNFIIDVSMFLITGGMWTIWILVREMRRR